MRTNLVFLSLVLSACQGVVASGTVTTTTREVPAFRRISIASGITATASAGSRALSIKADDNLQPLIETFVEDDTLIVRLKPMTLVGPVRTMDATISNDAFEALDASGGSHVTLPATPVTRFPISASGGSVVDVTGLSSADFTVDASGGSRVKVSGAATSASASASGGSDLEFTAVPLESLRVDASGGSTVKARVSGSLTGSASGGSTLTIVGMPSSQVDTSGGSHVRLGAQ
ncbi:MAG: DUF2807 domain-containing protein [Archangium sp.]|nr:DUF2807 domain-containing protein [Archangium sp.]